MAPLHAGIRPPRLPFLRFLCRVSGETDIAAHKEVFSRRMSMAGLKHHHHIAMGISGGPDSMALCALAAAWRREALSPDGNRSGFIDGLLGIVVDHRLRPGSSEEAYIVKDRVINLGIRCEVRCCDWGNGKPKQGEIQEAAREMRYEIFQQVCMEERIGILLLAHHADDQNELFILRLSRGSGVLGLAGMAFISQLFPKDACYYEDEVGECGIILVRPLLEFSKVDLYEICEGSSQEWVEDPSNQNKLFARNRIRCSLKAISSCVFKSEMQVLITACQLTRSFIDSICRRMISQSVTISDHGYTIIHMDKLEPSKVNNHCLSRFMAMVLQFISQKKTPARGRALSLVLNYIRGVPCKTSLSVAGCFLSPVPGSKGIHIVVCHSFDLTTLSKVKSTYICLKKQQGLPSSETKEIIMTVKSESHQSLPGVLRLPILSFISSEAILTEARKLNLISESTFQSILSLQSEEVKNFCKKTENERTCGAGRVAEVENCSRIQLFPGQLCHFMGRFLVKWEHAEWVEEKVHLDMFDIPTLCSEGKDKNIPCCFCMVDQESKVVVRCMIDSDWLYLSKVSEGLAMNYKNSSYLKLSAQKALQTLKSIPVCARRTLPVFINSRDLIISIPSISFKCCEHFSAIALFKPRVPLGGGFTSYI